MSHIFNFEEFMNIYESLIKYLSKIAALFIYMLKSTIKLVGNK